jgi:serine/threonine-protein kinase
MAAAGEPSIKATLRHGAPATQGASVPSATGTLVGLAPTPLAPVDLGESDVAPSAPSAPSSAARPVGTPGAGTTAAARTTVLPRRRSAGRSVAEERQRFERVRVLGEGGMGLVELARDNDIRRTVAVKRIHADGQADDALLRFADEVRIVGQLEHPAIVPVYDVGRDESGQVYLVMKHLNGETMEQVIEKLRAREPAYVERYSIEYRVHLFLAVLDAIRYAHARGVIHRDLKPANVMIGPYGEVTVLDWGIAKPIGGGASATADVQPLERTLVDSHDKRLQQTQFGSLAGTPLYMSPEQAAGRNDDLDERSDVYSLCVLFYEWLALKHPIQGKQTITEVLAAIISGEAETTRVFEAALLAGVPAEWVHIVKRGLTRDRDRRFSSVAQLEDAVKGVLNGRVRIQCHVTLAKRAAHGALHWIDRHPFVYSIFFFLSLALLAAGLGLAAYHLIRG